MTSKNQQQNRRRNQNSDTAFGGNKREYKQKNKNDLPAAETKSTPVVNRINLKKKVKKQINSNNRNRNNIYNENLARSSSKADQLKSQQQNDSDEEDKTMDDNIWKDDFDKLLDGKEPLRKNNIIRKDVRASFNFDSSIESNSITKDKSFDSYKKRQKNLIINVKRLNPPTKKTWLQKKTIKMQTSSTNKLKRGESLNNAKQNKKTIISTPKTKCSKNIFKLSLSPISKLDTPKVFAPSCNDESLLRGKLNLEYTSDLDSYQKNLKNKLNRKERQNNVFNERPVALKNCTILQDLEIMGQTNSEENKITKELPLIIISNESINKLNETANTDGLLNNENMANTSLNSNKNYAKSTIMDEKQPSNKKVNSSFYMKKKISKDIDEGFQSPEKQNTKQCNKEVLQFKKVKEKFLKYNCSQLSKSDSSISGQVDSNHLSHNSRSAKNSEINIKTIDSNALEKPITVRSSVIYSSHKTFPSNPESLIICQKMDEQIQLIENNFDLFLQNKNREISIENLTQSIIIVENTLYLLAESSVNEVSNNCSINKSLPQLSLADKIKILKTSLLENNVNNNDNQPIDLSCRIVDDSGEINSNNFFGQMTDLDSRHNENKSPVDETNEINEHKKLDNYEIVHNSNIEFSKINNNIQGCEEEIVENFVVDNPTNQQILMINENEKKNSVISVTEMVQNNEQNCSYKTDILRVDKTVETTDGNLLFEDVVVEKTNLNAKIEQNHEIIYDSDSDVYEVVEKNLEIIYVSDVDEVENTNLNTVNDEIIRILDGNEEINENQRVVETTTEILIENKLTDKNLFIDKEKNDKFENIDEIKSPIKSKYRKSQQIDQCDENLKNVNNSTNMKTNLRITKITDEFNSENSNSNKKAIINVIRMKNIDNIEKRKSEKLFENKIDNRFEDGIPNSSIDRCSNGNNESVIDVSLDVIETRKNRDKRLFKCKIPNVDKKSTKRKLLNKNRLIDLAKPNMKKCFVRLKRLQISKGINVQNNSPKVLFTSEINKLTESNELDYYSETSDDGSEFRGFSSRCNKYYMTKISQLKEKFELSQKNNSSNRDQVLDTHHIFENNQPQEISNDNLITEINQTDHDPQSPIRNNADSEENSEIILGKKTKFSNEIIFDPVAGYKAFNKNRENEFCNSDKTDGLDKTNHIFGINAEISIENVQNVQIPIDKFLNLPQSPAISRKHRENLLQISKGFKNLKYLSTNCSKLNNNKLRKNSSKIKKCVVRLENLNINEKKNILIPISQIKKRNMKNSEKENQSYSRFKTKPLKNKINKLEKEKIENSEYQNYQSKNKIKVKLGDKKTRISPVRSPVNLSESLTVNISSDSEGEQLNAADETEENELSSIISSNKPLNDVLSRKTKSFSPNNKQSKINQEINTNSIATTSAMSKSSLTSKNINPISSPINNNFNNIENDLTLNSNTLLKNNEEEKLGLMALPRGKWRRSITNWKNRIRQDITEGNNESVYRNSMNLNKKAIQNIPSGSNNIINNSIGKKKFINSFSVIKERQSQNDSLIKRNKPFGIRKTLLLESTDDDSPNLTSVSIFDKLIEQKNSKGRSSSISKTFSPELEEENINELVVQPESDKEKSRKNRNSNEKGLLRFNNSRQLQHQSSVPVSGNQQFSPPIRCRRTSVNQPSSERGILYESQQKQDHLRDEITCQKLNISIREHLSPRDIVLRHCSQTYPLDFYEVYSEEKLPQCRKIGEGVYGEVFMSRKNASEATVLKVIPIDGTIEVNGERQKNFEEILPEIIIAKELSLLRNDKKHMTSGFVDVKNVCCVLGRYPEHLIDLWELYRDNRGTENDHPEIFPEDQLYIVFELANGGQDLEAYTFENACQAHSAFLQVAVSLAIAETKFQFEHRDLHWGNILLAPTENKEIVFKLNGREIKIPTNGVLATIIDYTLSRVIFQGCCLYNDLANDNELFSATGDYQFNIYRLMKKRNGDDWAHYEPFTNVLWLHYMVDKLIDGARYRSSKTKTHRSAVKAFMDLRDKFLNFQSASNYIESLN